MRITEQFNPITRTKILDMYSRRMLPIDTYLYLIKGILVPDHVNLKISSISEFCHEWKIPRSSFYRGMSKLEKSGLGKLEPIGGSIFSCYPLLKGDDGMVTNEILNPENDCPTSENDCPTSEKIEAENPHHEPVLRTSKYIQIDPDRNQMNLSLDPERAREEKKESAIEIFSEEVSTQEGSMDKPYLSDPEYLHLKAVYDKTALVIKNPIVLAKMRVQYLGRWEGNEQTHTSPSEQADMVMLEPDREIKEAVTQPVTLAKKINPIVDDIPAIESNSQLATKKVDPYFPAKSTISYKRELAKNSTTIFPDVEKEDEFYEQYRHYLKATNPRLLPGNIEAIALASLKRINSSATNPSDRAILKLWESGELKDFVGATYDAMASRVADARERIDRALNSNRGYQHAF